MGAKGNQGKQLEKIAILWKIEKKDDKEVKVLLRHGIDFDFTIGSDNPQSNPNENSYSFHIISRLEIVKLENHPTFEVSLVKTINISKYIL